MSSSSFLLIRWCSFTAALFLVNTSLCLAAITLNSDVDVAMSPPVPKSGCEINSQRKRSLTPMEWLSTSSGSEDESSVQSSVPSPSGSTEVSTATSRRSLLRPQDISINVLYGASGNTILATTLDLDAGRYQNEDEGGWNHLTRLVRMISETLHCTNQMHMSLLAPNGEKLESESQFRSLLNIVSGRTGGGSPLHGQAHLDLRVITKHGGWMDLLRLSSSARENGLSARDALRRFFAMSLGVRESNDLKQRYIGDFMNIDDMNSFRRTIYEYRSIRGWGIEGIEEEITESEETGEDEEMGEDGMGEDGMERGKRKPPDVSNRQRILTGDVFQYNGVLTLGGNSGNLGTTEVTIGTEELFFDTFLALAAELESGAAESAGDNAVGGSSPKGSSVLGSSVVEMLDQFDITRYPTATLFVTETGNHQVVEVSIPPGGDPNYRGPYADIDIGQHSLRRAREQEEYLKLSASVPLQVWGWQKIVGEFNVRIEIELFRYGHMVGKSIFDLDPDPVGVNLAGHHLWGGA